MEITRESFIVVATVAALAPVIADLTARARVPIVVVEVGLGIVVGPDVLGLAEADAFLEALAAFGLAFLFFLAGIEIEFSRLRGRPAILALGGWGTSLVLGVAMALLLWGLDVIAAPILVGLALTTTALGTLMPVMRDAGLLEGEFGRYVVGAGAIGEFGPLVAVSVILALESGQPWNTALLLVFAAVAVAASLVAMRARPARLVRLVNETMRTSGQLAVRLALLLLAVLVVVAADLGLDVILGAFAAGIVAGIVLRGSESDEFLTKLDAIGFGFLIPVFFITTGMDFNLDALVDHPTGLLLLPAFAALFLVVRGLPALLLYRRVLPAAERVPLALLSASALPLVIAITEIGTETGAMPEAEAVALVGAGMLSVLLFPVLALAARGRGPR